METYSSTLFQARTAYVYRIPPRSSVGGYKASEWADPKTGDLVSTAIWKGRLKVVEREVEEDGGKRRGYCDVRLEDSDSGELFALCPYDAAGGSVEAVLDSSRYFVLRVENDDGTGKKRRAFIGMGFEDRSDSFDFNVSLQDWVKRQRHAESASSGDDDGDGSASASSAPPGPSPHLPTDGPRDFSLKDGQTFSIKLPGGGSGGGASPMRKIRDGKASGGGAGGLGGFSLPPPPPGRRG